MSSQDPGTGGPKLSKSGDATDKLYQRNKSYNKVLDAQIAWMYERRRGCVDMADELRVRWIKKSEWHEKTYGW